MPYISQVRRKAVRTVETEADQAGELNYEITTLVNSYVRRHGLKYEVLNAVVGALESAKAEFQRRVVAPYEDRKIQENGDVYDTRSR